MGKININNTFYDIYNNPKLLECRDYLFAYARHGRYFKTEDMKISEIVSVKPTWNPNDLVYGANRLLEMTNEKFFFSVYSDSEIKQDQDKEKVKLFYFRSHTPSKKFAIICSGGAYQGVCGFAEGFSCAAKLNELGYHAFVLCYRVNLDGLMPKPLDDLAAAHKFITNNFDVNKDEYIILGSSAGANMAALFGTYKFGYKYYNLPKPKLILVEYPFISFSIPKSLFRDGLENTMFSKNQDIHTYDLENAMDYDYPTTYACICKDDPDVNPENVKLYDRLLTKYNIKHICFIGEEGGHGYGLGTYSDCKDWIVKALELIK